MTRHFAVLALVLPLLSACTFRRPCQPPCNPCGCADAPPAAAPAAMTIAPTTDPLDDKLVLQVHHVDDLVNGDEAKMERLLTKARVMGSFPGGSIAQQGLASIIVKAPHRVQSLVESMLGNERIPLRLKYFDVKDVIAAHPTLLDDLRPLLGGVEGRTIDLKNGTLIVRASSEVLDSIGAKLDAWRAAK